MLVSIQKLCTMMNTRLLYFLYFSCLAIVCDGKIHTLSVNHDSREYITLTSFGYYAGGSLEVNMSDFHFTPAANSTNIGNNPLFGFILGRILNNEADPNSQDIYPETCALYDESLTNPRAENRVYFIMDLEKNEMRINCSARENVSKLEFYNSTIPSPMLDKIEAVVPDDSKISRDEHAIIPKGLSCAQNLILPLNRTPTNNFSTQFAVRVPSEAVQGQYALVFYSCANFLTDRPVLSSFTMKIIEKNYIEDAVSYLSAGEIPLPLVYFSMSYIFLVSTIVWIYLLVKSRHPVYKTHYLMACLVILKTLGLLFHGINYHFIGINGQHVATWAILYYIIHFLRGAVLFITVILIGTGWTFIKHILSPKDKKIFMIVIPLQLFASVAEIIIDESQEGDAEYKTWFDVFVFVNVICSIPILLPVRWSIKHLQDASQTDGKAAINLKKLKLFRHFYILIVCFYLTRFIMYFLKIALPFQYDWLHELSLQVAMFIFFILTGYKFRPASENPYFHVPEEDETDMDIVISKCGLTEGLTKLSRIPVSNDLGDDDKDSLLIFKRESCYDYD